MKIISLFDGISCARVALERAGIPVKTYTAIEIDKYAVQISNKNYPDIYRWDDVKTYNGCDGIYDLLIGGSPCQDLSIAKKNRKGLDGERSGLFNVNSMPKEARELISKTLGVEPIMINASLVSAQNRKRLFWTNIPNVTLPEDRNIYLKDILESGESDRLKSYCIDASYYKGASWKQYKEKGRRQLIKIGAIGKDSMGSRVYSPEGISKTLSANGGGWGAKTGLYLVKGVASRTYPRTPNGKPREKRIEIRDDEKANSMTSVQSDSMVAIKDFVRKLTPIECERLQGLPDNYTEGVSNTQRYKTLGNAFNVDVVAHILSFIK